jgi:hypothetical protein
VAWLSAVTVDSRLCGLQIFNGPLTDVPHIVSRAVLVNDSTIRFTLDFRPRAYGAYEMRRPDGSYPGPDELGRKSFEYSGARYGGGFFRSVRAFAGHNLMGFLWGGVS